MSDFAGKAGFDDILSTFAPEEMDQFMTDFDTSSLFPMDNGPDNQRGADSLDMLGYDNDPYPEGPLEEAFQPGKLFRYAEAVGLIDYNQDSVAPDVFAASQGDNASKDGDIASQEPVCQPVLKRETQSLRTDGTTAIEQPTAQFDNYHIQRAEYRVLPFSYQAQNRLLPKGPRPITKFAAKAIPVYEHQLETFDDARQTLQSQMQGEPMIMLNLQGDDWQWVKDKGVHHYASQLFAALTAPFAPAPVAFVDYQVAYYEAHQRVSHGNVVNMVQRESLQAEARVLLMLEEVIKVHSHGVPESIMTRTAVKSGYIPERDLICSERVEKVILAAKADKYIAHDILSGSNLVDIARSPDRYLRRKRENSRVNAKKAEDKKGRASKRAAPASGSKAVKRPRGSYATPPAAEQQQYAESEENGADL